jgi:hypothetical protein
MSINANPIKSIVIPTSNNIKTINPPLGSIAWLPKISCQLIIIQIKDGIVITNCAISHNMALQAVNADAFEVLIP